MNKDNLVKLAKYILEEVTDEQFDMIAFRSNHIGTGVVNCDFKSKNDCGTIGCALGWAPFTKGLEVVEDDFIESYITDYEHLSFHNYSKRIFGSYHGDIWDFIFSGDWYVVDNSREGFVKRVIYFLDHPYRKIDENKIYDYCLFRRLFCFF